MLGEKIFTVLNLTKCAAFVSNKLSFKITYLFTDQIWKLTIYFATTFMQYLGFSYYDNQKENWRDPQHD